MQNWLGAVFLAFTSLVVGVQVGRRGPAGAFRPVPLILVLSSVLLVLRLRDTTGFAPTVLHVVAAVALLVLGLVLGRAAGAPRIRDPFEDADRSDAEMYRRAGMSPEAIDMEMKYRGVRREAATHAASEARVHVDRAAGFAMTIPPSWQPALPLPEFVASGGRLAIAHVTGRATLNVSCGPLDDPRLAEPGAREATLRRIVSESRYAEAAIGRPAVSGERNAIRGDWVESDGGRAGLLSIVRNGTEYVVQWKAGPDHAAATSSVVDSFRLL